MQRYTWKTDVTWLALLVTGAMLIGWLAGAVLWAVVIALLVYIAWNIRQLHLVNIWLARYRSDAPPQSHGLWGQVFDNAHALQIEGAERHLRLQAMIDYQRDSFASLADAVVMLDAHGNIEWSNQASAALLGLRQPEDIGQPISNLIRNPDFIRYFEAEKYGEALALDSPSVKSIKLNITITFFGQRSRLLFARDVTRTHTLEEMRKNFVANVSHELRTPLTVIISYLDTLSNQPVPNAHWEKALSQMSSHSQRMRQLVEDLMTLSRLETVPQPSQWELINIAALMDMLREEIEVSAVGERKVVIECESSMQLHGSDQELRSAFSNLAVNAARYTREGDRITLRWSVENGRGIFQVEDTGPGIEAEHIPRLTERFYRVDPSRSSATGGTGLGLAIVKHTLMRHRGELSIRSVPGIGSTFSCSFPYSAVRSAPQQKSLPADA